MDAQDLVLAEHFFGNNPDNFKRNVTLALTEQKTQQQQLEKQLVSALQQLNGWQATHQELNATTANQFVAATVAKGITEAKRLLTPDLIQPKDNSAAAFKTEILRLLKQDINADELINQVSSCTHQPADLKRGCAGLRVVSQMLETQCDVATCFGSDSMEKEQKIAQLLKNLKLWDEKNTTRQNQLNASMKAANETEQQASKTLQELLRSAQQAAACLAGTCQDLQNALKSTQANIERMDKAIVHIDKVQLTVQTNPEQWPAILIKDAGKDYADLIQASANAAVKKHLVAGFSCRTPQIGNQNCEPGYALNGMVRYLENLVIYLQQGGYTKELVSANQALKLAHDLSARRQYLTPVTAYLRSSYPSSAMQQNNSASDWHNMLGRGAVRSIPWLGGKIATDDNPTQQQIDKQFWQNINTVRVSGAGDTNYVVVKDDIGNWYVKGYSSDPSEIYNTVANMALVNAAGQAGFLLDQGSGALALKNSANVLDVMYGRFYEKYAAATQTQFEALKNWLELEHWKGPHDNLCVPATASSPAKTLLEVVGEASMNTPQKQF